MHYKSFPPWTQVIIVTLLLATRSSALFANYSGDVLVGSLFPIHSHELLLTNMRDQCGDIQVEDGILPLEALLYTLDEINNSSLLPGFTLGTIALDSCDSDTHALGQAVEFVKILVTRATHGDVAFVCADNSKPILKPGVEEFNKVVGVVGGSSSSVSIAVANLLRLFNVPQVSYLSTSPDLSNKDTFTYFQRTVPSDVNQAQAIVEILKRFRWTYVSMLFDDTNYGEKLSGEFQKFAERNGICLAVQRRISVGPLSNRTKRFDELFRDIQAKPDAKAVVLLTYRNTAQELFQAAKRANSGGKFVYIGSDGWSGRMFPSELDDIIMGAISVQPLSRVLPGFDDYFLSLTPETMSSSRNPWFHEYWESTFGCTFGNTSHKRPPCTGKENPRTKYTRQLTLHYVRWSVLVFAHALKDMHAHWCNGTRGLCPVINPMKNPLLGKMLQKYVENVTFYDEKLHQTFSFVNKVDGPPRYSIFVYNRQNLSLQWTEVGSYSGVQGEDRLNFTKRFADMVNQVISPYPESRCSKPCSEGQAMKLLETDKCCWICTNCSTNEYLSDPNTCMSCDEGFVPNLNRSACRPLPLVYITYTEGLSIAALTCSAVGIMGSLIVGGLFTLHRKTPIIKAAGKELSYFLLAGIFVSYLSSFVHLWKPSMFVCGFRRFLVGFAYTTCYAPILVKTNRISRIFNSISGPKKPKYISPLSQVVMTGVLISINVIITLLWIGIDNPQTKRKTEEDNQVLICNGEDNVVYIIAFAYPFLLLLACSFYAFRTRKAPDGFNETRYIAFTSYTTFVMWLAFVPFYFSTQQHQLRPFIICMSLFVSASVSLCCLFVPKIYIILMRPEKNTKDAVMQRTRRISSMNNSMGDNFTSLEGSRSRQHCPSTSSGAPMEDICETMSPSSSVWTVSTTVHDSIFQPDDDSGVFSGTPQPTEHDGSNDGSLINNNSSQLPILVEVTHEMNTAQRDIHMNTEPLVMNKL